jgi:hypothetical protein
MPQEGEGRNEKLPLRSASVSKRLNTRIRRPDYFRQLRRRSIPEVSVAQLQMPRSVD